MPEIMRYIKQDNVVLTMLDERSKSFEGGDRIEIPISRGANPTVAVRSPKASIPLAEHDPLAKISVPWKSASGSIVVYKEDQRRNRGEAQIIDFVGELKSNLQDTFQNVLAEQVWSSGTGSFDFWGINKWNAATGNCGYLLTAQDEDSGDETMTAINRTSADYADFRANILSTAEAIGFTGGTDGGIQVLLRYCLRGGSAGKANKKPSIFVTTDLLWDALSNLLTLNEKRYDPKLAEIGFENFTYRGIPFTKDPYVPTGECHCLNWDVLQLVKDSLNANELQQEAPHELEDRRGWRILYAYDGNIVCKMPMHIGKLTGKTA